MFLLTDWKAPNSRVLRVDLNDIGAPETWREVIPERDHVLEDFTLAGGKLAAQYLENVIPRVRILEPGGKLVREISMPSLGSTSNLQGRWSSNETFFSFTSFHIPQTIYRYDVATGSRQVWSERKVPLDSSKLDVKQVWYKSKDGTRIPMFLLHGKGMNSDGNRPVFLTAYGGFRASMTPVFMATAVAWAERGGVFALPNLRGGLEFGEEWHKAGMLDKKQNVFDDFIAAAEWLIANNYTKPSRIAISGTSNGGLLVGAAITQRPELFGAAHSGYPLLDMVRYHKFLVARFWTSEYGSSEDPEQFKYIYAYSPYHRVKQGTKYPAVLFTTGDSDTRVAPLHARKMAALMQSATESGRPVLLLYDTKAGHSAGGAIREAVDRAADTFTFLWWQTAGQ